MSPDLLSPLLAHFSIDAGVFYSGNVCGVHDFEPDGRRGHLHLIRQGRVNVMGGRGLTIEVDRPTLLFLPRSWKHQLIAPATAGADVICATVVFGGGARSPIAESLPDVLQVELASLSGAMQLIELMMAEAAWPGPGSKSVVDRLCAVLIIRLLRHSMDLQLVRRGALAGLADRRLANALDRLHAAPNEQWNLSNLAEAAGMSRSRFAQRFREVTGQTPAD